MWDGALQPSVRAAEASSDSAATHAPNFCGFLFVWCGAGPAPQKSLQVNLVKQLKVFEASDLESFDKNKHLASFC